ncbi:ubiquitin-protein ligase [Lithospermum erythrorhizon]|uniref:Ubiquitin-protein ligase n=1 Tax=Lithospermum erythrorhizon TaxID=34254 RepID=A0AAV3QP92_LITER
MGDHFVLLANRLLTESTLEAVTQSKRQLQNIPITDDDDVMIDLTSYVMDIDVDTSALKLVQCRICHDEDVDSNMEVPCSCCGSVKYAHRRCVQRWCNEKGDTNCEICQQQFKPGYTATPTLYHYGSIPMTFRDNWEISRRDLHNSQLIPLVSADRNFLDPHYTGNSNASSIVLTFFHLVAIIFMIVLVAHHTFPAVINGSEQYPIALFTLLSLRSVGILLAIYLILRSLITICRRYLLQDFGSSLLATSGEEEDFHLRRRRPT